MARLVVERGLGLVYLVAFVAAFRQWVPLVGEHGLLPARRFVQRVPFRRAPSLFHLRCTDRTARAAAVVGIVLALAVVAGGVERLPWPAAAAVWALMWALQLSFLNVGQAFWGFGWESLLAEAGFLAIFLGPRGTAVPVLVLWADRWLAVRLELGAGLIKWRGDRCWRDLTCLAYHHETQPLPNPLSWYFHHLPMPLHRVEVAANMFAQLALPVLLFAPQPVAGVVAVALIVTQAWLVLSGNFSWLNLLTMVVLVAAVPDGWLAWLPGDVPPTHPSSPWSWAVGGAVAALVLVLSRQPLRNLLSSRQAMNTSYDPLHLVNSYGAFGSITRHREEVVIEATDRDVDPAAPDAAGWRPYELPAKPGDPARRPRQVAPYHLRLDWMLWFVGISPRYGGAWLDRLVERLLEADQATLRLFRIVSFGSTPPRAVRIRRYRYRFTTRAERRATGDWWHREPIGTLLPPVCLDADGRVVRVAGGSRDRRR